MNYTHIYKGWAVPDDYINYDGCTMPNFIKELLDADRFDDNICKLHDFQTTFNFLPRSKVDAIFRDAIRDIRPTVKYKFIAWIVWIIVRINSIIKFSVWRPTLPKEWAKFSINIYK